MIHPHSLEAYWAGKDDLFGKRHQKVIAALRAHNYPMTDRMVMTACGFIEPNAVRPRITELIEVGIIIECGSVKCPISGQTVRLVKLRKHKPEAQFEMAEILTPSVMQQLKTG